jgi:hypothetical protein
MVGRLGTRQEADAVERDTNAREGIATARARGRLTIFCRTASAGGGTLMTIQSTHLESLEGGSSRLHSTS